MPCATAPLRGIGLTDSCRVYLPIKNSADNYIVIRTFVHMLRDKATG
jgi:hypothetical protein